MSTQNGKAAIVTGASRGIGAALAQRLAADGFAVVVNFVGAASEADATVARIREGGGVASAVRADVSDGGAVRALFEATEQLHGGVDVLVNNAGIMHLTTFAEAATPRAARAAGHARGHRRRRRFPRGARRGMGQRPGAARQWRRGVRAVHFTPVRKGDNDAHLSSSSSRRRRR